MQYPLFYQFYDGFKNVKKEVKYKIFKKHPQEDLQRYFFSKLQTEENIFIPLELACLTSILGTF